MAKLGWLKVLSRWLTLIGGLNWGLVGLADFNLVQYLMGMIGQIGLVKPVYIIVGAAAVTYAVMKYQDKQLLKG